MKLISFLATSLLGASLSVGAFAVDAPLAAKKPATPAGHYPEACAAEIHQYCADVIPGEGRRRACLKEHAKQVSEGCKAAVAMTRHHPKATKARTPRRALPVIADAPDDKDTETKK